MAANHARSWQESYQTNYEPKKEKVVIRKKNWITKGEKVLYSFLCLSLLIAGGFIVSYSSSNDTLNRQVQTLEENVQAQEVKNENLLFEIKELSRPERITKIAEENGLKLQETEVKQAAFFN